MISSTTEEIIQELRKIVIERHLKLNVVAMFYGFHESLDQGIEEVDAHLDLLETAQAAAEGSVADSSIAFSSVTDATVAATPNDPHDNDNDSLDGSGGESGDEDFYDTGYDGDGILD
jgi:hypothetical protein